MSTFVIGLEHKVLGIFAKNNGVWKPVKDIKVSLVEPNGDNNDNKCDSESPTFYDNFIYDNLCCNNA